VQKDVLSNQILVTPTQEVMNVRVRNCDFCVAFLIPNLLSQIQDFKKNHHPMIVSPKIRCCRECIEGRYMNHASTTRAALGQRTVKGEKPGKIRVKGILDEEPVLECPWYLVNGL